MQGFLTLILQAGNTRTINYIYIYCHHFAGTSFLLRPLTLYYSEILISTQFGNCAPSITFATSRSPQMATECGCAFHQSKNALTTPSAAASCAWSCYIYQVLLVVQLHIPFCMQNADAKWKKRICIQNRRTFWSWLSKLIYSTKTFLDVTDTSVTMSLVVHLGLRKGLLLLAATRLQHWPIAMRWSSISYIIMPILWSVVASSAEELMAWVFITEPAIFTINQIDKGHIYLVTSPSNQSYWSQNDY